MKPTKKASEMSIQELARYIDYSVLKPQFSEKEIVELCKKGVSLGVAQVCISPAYMALCEPYVKGTHTKLGPTCDFPFGNTSLESKVAQAKLALAYDTVGELDMVANFGLIRSGKYDEVAKEIHAVADVCHEKGIELKVILETGALNEEQIRKGARTVVAGGADWVKTSTGFLTGFDDKGATPEIIQILMDEVGGQIKIKGSGHIRTREHFLKLIDMGIDRMGVGYKSVPVVLGLDEEQA
ncbi:MAG: deoxyribose-phosphate aldolase [Catenisphaera adipataccumulans]|jgi:deoxyribose-phosphate aldolase|uniref:deoxyribose-phosphate aldolase n=1 Tax=Catenisphaera adipataccumulans TaxID=700500 RepID=UPI003D8F178D